MTAVVMATVVAVRSLSPSFVTITLAGCAGIQSGGLDQRIKILLAQAGQDQPVLPSAENWYDDFRAMPAAARPVMRTFTIRAQRGDLIDIEFALHGDAGPASAWARSARPGSRLGIIGPAHGDAVKALQYAPGVHDWQLLVADETALPALASIVESLPAGTIARAFIQVPDADDARSFRTAADLEVTYAVRHGVLDAVRAARWPAGTPYAWIAGESRMVRDLRRHLTKELGWQGASHYFGGYWKSGQSES